jgi:acetyl esterase/lipase
MRGQKNMSNNIEINQMKRKLCAGVLFFLVPAIGLWAQTRIIQLYSGKPPGSESWNWEEKRQDSNMFQTPVVYNVVQPTLTVFAPEAGKANGTAIIIAPGGGFHLLSIDREGNDVARWLAARGVTAFVLKYRVVHTNGNDPIKEMMAGLTNRKAFDSANKIVIPLAVADGLAAMEYVRRNASEFHVVPERIGFMGFSAGGTVTMGVAYHCTTANHPNFIAPIYAYFASEIGGNMPSDKMPAFITAASDDQLGLAPHSITIYNNWINAKQSAEIHIYAKGGHGFGMKKQNLPIDEWIERFGDWLKLQGLLKQQG